MATGGGSSKSDVWKHFTKTTKKKVVTCNVCSREFAYHGGTSNLCDHLQCLHPDIYKNPEEKQQTLTVIMQKCSEAKTKAIDELLVDVVTMDIRPLAIVEGEGMCRLINYLEPRYCLLSRKHVMKLLRSKYGRGVLVLKEKLAQDAAALALTLDIWTSNTM